jgi:hypothetical protein
MRQLHLLLLFEQRNKYFALTPEIFFELTYPVAESNKVRRETIFEDRDDEIRIFNMLVASRGYEYAYSGDKALLEKLLSGRANPGKLEKIYYGKFELPWILARRNGKG